MHLRYSKHFSFCIFIACLIAQPQLSQSIPVSEKITIGKLENGLTYYVRENSKPANRAELRLLVNVGSIDEDDDQRGLAHFIEHMCFNGTEKYPQNKIIDYMESIGMSFGPDVNAYTSFDRTVYKLQVPTDDREKFESAVEILSQWAGYLTLDNTEIDKERGVITEEWRLRRGANARINDEQHPVLFSGSKYAERIPIGLPEVIERAPFERFRDFYEKWYRPDLMAVVAVGDFLTDDMLELIERYFGPIPVKSNLPEPGYFPIPKHREPAIKISIDPEARFTKESVIFKYDVLPSESVEDYLLHIKRSMVNRIFSDRLYELTKSKDAPFTYASSNLYRYLEPVELMRISGYTDKDHALEGLERIFLEINRLKMWGITSTELSRMKNNYFKNLESKYIERDKTSNKRLVRELVENFLTGEPVPGIEWEYSFVKKHLDSITVDDLSRVIQELFTDENMVILISEPGERNTATVSEDDIRRLISEVPAMKPDPYIDDIPEAPLLETRPVPGRIVSENYIEDLDLTEWIFSNGARVVVKPTDFKNDEVVMRCFAPGGNSITAEEEYRSGALATSIVREAGLGSYSVTQFNKFMKDKHVMANPYIGLYYHGMNGRFAPEDIETFFQVFYLRWTDPVVDNDSFNRYMENRKIIVKNMRNSPDDVWGELVQKVNYSDHYTRMPWDETELNKVDLNEAIRIYNERFANPANFTFIFVGALNLEEFRIYAETYIGGLPVNSREITESREIKYHFPLLPVRKKLEMGIEPKSRTKITFYHPVEKDFESLYYLKAASEILETRLRKLLREELGATYYVASGRFNLLPVSKHGQTYIRFDTDPERTKELISLVFKEVRRLKKEGPGEEEISAFVEKELQKHETNLESNGYWGRALQYCFKFGVDPHDILTRDQRIRSVTPDDVKEMVRVHYPRFRNTVITLYPEK